MSCSEFSSLKNCGVCPTSNIKGPVKACLTVNPTPGQMVAKGLLKVGATNSHSLKRARAAFLKDVEWPQNYNLQIGYYKDGNYSEAKSEWVKKCVTEKLAPLVNLTLVWDIDLEKADVRISFDPSAGAWSYIGTEAKSQSGPTMNLGWLDNDVDFDFPEAKGTGAVVIHEFGHAIGMIHEHTRADAKLKWNCNQLYSYLSGPPNSWNCDTIISNILKTYGTDQFNGSEYDPLSIMHYWFPPQFFCDKKVLPHNVKLSDLDVEWISNTYPRVDRKKPDQPGPLPSPGWGKIAMITASVALGLLLSKLLIVDWLLKRKAKKGKGK